MININIKEIVFVLLSCGLVLNTTSVRSQEAINDYYLQQLDRRGNLNHIESFILLIKNQKSGDGILLADAHLTLDKVKSLNNLAALYYNQGRYSEAEPLYLQALSLRKKLLGEEHLSVATSLNNLALLYESQGRYSEAEPLYLQSLSLSKKTARRRASLSSR